MIPPFTDDGFLPPGVHTATLAEFEERFVNSTSSERRRELFERLREVIADAHRTPWVRHVYVAGSFVTAKPHPGDFDCLLVLDPAGANAELRPFEYNLFIVKAAKRRHRGDVFAVSEGTPLHNQLWDFFQSTRQGGRVGIVKVTL
ncbi:MAG TPA: hypothetical protein VMP01_29915 [Pirellulaceae bacterium]|nr:hypothetical protein [Pirellulaceae bacterium]